MPGIIPDSGVLYTDPNVENATLPGPPFSLSCDYEALPSNCSARILPAQINGLVSELLGLAACFNPDGTWDCDATTNLCDAFTAYRTESGDDTLEDDVQRILCGTPDGEYSPALNFLYCDGSGNVGQATIDIGAYLCASTPGEYSADLKFLYCDGSGDVKQTEIDIGAIICDATDGTYSESLKFLYCDSGVLKKVAIPIPDDPDPPPEGISHGITGTQNVTASNRVLDDLSVPPFGLQTINIPNTSTVPIKVAVYLGLDVDLQELTPGAQGNISFSRFTNADGSGGVIMDAHVGVRNINTGGNPIFSIKPSAWRIFEIPPGGLDMHFGFEGGSNPASGYRVDNLDGEIRVYGVYAGTWDTF